LIHYRTFRNQDLPALAEIWRSQAPERALMQPMSADLFESHVLSKPYFDSRGLIVALDDGVPVGFAHAGFGPNSDETGLSTQLGVTCLVLVRPNYHRRGIGGELLKRAEEYLRLRGAEVLYGGGIRPLNPFYLGLYGGSELPGVLISDAAARRLYESSGYVEIDRTIVLHRELGGFRPPVDRQQMQIRRRYNVHEVPDPRLRTWWEACTYGGFELTRFNLVQQDSGPSVATTLLWSMGPLATSWGVHAAGLIEVEVDPALRRQGLATFLLAEVFRRLQIVQNTSLIEAQTMCHNTAALAMYRKLGFSEVDQGIVYRKQAEVA
jgi:GNAT superfamily N-acetyltransferase